MVSAFGANPKETATYQSRAELPLLCFLGRTIWSSRLGPNLLATDDRRDRFRHIFGVVLPDYGFLHQIFSGRR
jgi:hypothetical protein